MQATLSGTQFIGPSIFERPLQILGKLSHSFSFLAPLLTRLVIGYAFMLTGRGKWMNFDNTVRFFDGLGIPLPQANAAFVSSLELIGGMAIMIGLGTRLFAFLLSNTMVVALLTADKESFLAKFGSDLTEVTPVVFLLFLIWLVLYGPGRLSLDAVIARAFRRTD